MDIYFMTEVLLELMEEKIFQVVFAGEIRRKPQEGDAADQEKRNKGDDNTRWGHLNASSMSDRQPSPVDTIVLTGTRT
jgi:hypothetical protein